MMMMVLISLPFVPVMGRRRVVDCGVRPLCWIAFAVFLNVRWPPTMPFFAFF
jgi:hypothetical protein